jgi:hypothetical protein
VVLPSYKEISFRGLNVLGFQYFSMSSVMLMLQVGYVPVVLMLQLNGVPVVLMLQLSDVPVVLML